MLEKWIAIIIYQTGRTSEIVSTRVILLSSILNTVATKTVKSSKMFTTFFMGDIKLDNAYINLEDGNLMFTV